MLHSRQIGSHLQNELYSKEALKCPRSAYGKELTLFSPLGGVGGRGDKIEIFELDFLHLQEGECNKMMRFGENQSSLA